MNQQTDCREGVGQNREQQGTKCEENTERKQKDKLQTAGGGIRIRRRGQVFGKMFRGSVWNLEPCSPDAVTTLLTTVMQELIIRGTNQRERLPLSLTTPGSG